MTFLLLYLVHAPYCGVFLRLYTTSASCACERCYKSSGKAGKSFDKELFKTKKLIEDQIAGNAEVKGRMDKVCDIKGVGTLTVATVVAEANGFNLIKNIPQLILYAGYDVVEDQSGKRTGKTKISKKGNAVLSHLLDQLALSTNFIRCSKVIAFLKRLFLRQYILN